MRGVFYPSGTNYFGFTQNNSGNWIGTVTDRSLYFTITKTDLVDASWSGKLKVKPDSSDSAYSGPGEYLFKIGRYTSVGDSSADWSNELGIKITGPTPAPTLDPTPTLAPTSTPTPTPIKTPDPTPTKTPTPKPISSQTVAVLGETTVDSPRDINGLGLQNELATFSPTPGSEKGSQGKFPFIAFGLIVSGLTFIGGSCYLAFGKRGKAPEEESLL